MPPAPRYNLINSIEKKSIQQCSERDSRSYQTLYFSFLEEFHVAACHQSLTKIAYRFLISKKVPTINQNIKPLDFFLKTDQEHH